MLFDQLFETLDTGNGYWNPWIWILSFIIVFLVIYILRGIGNTSYKRGTEQTKVFLSGNPEYGNKEELHIKASNIYWGWLEATGWFITLLKKMHTGRINDYILWFTFVAAILMILIVVI